MDDRECASAVKKAVANLNEALARAAHAGLTVHLEIRRHQTVEGSERLVADVEIQKRL